MKSKTLRVLIDRPVHEVWEFTTNPTNTAEWLDFIEHEESSAWPAHVGAIYRNQHVDGSTGEYLVTVWEPEVCFQLVGGGGSFVVEYGYSSAPDGRCELRYSERSNEGELSDLFTQKQLEHLKHLMENRRP